MVTTEKQGNLYIVRIIDNFTWDDVHDAIDKAEDSQPQGMILDMEQLAMLNSSSVGLLLAMFNSLKEIGIQIVVAGLTAGNCRLLKLSKLDRIFPVYDTIEEGFRHFESFSN